MKAILNNFKINSKRIFYRKFCTMNFTNDFNKIMNRMRNIKLKIYKTNKDIKVF